MKVEFFKIPLVEIENSKLNCRLERKPRQVREMELEGMFGKHRVMVSAEPPRAGRKRLPFRLMHPCCT